MYTKESIIRSWVVLDIVENVLERFFRTREMYFLTGNVILQVE